MNRQFNTPSPVVFPSASPTPKLLCTPSKKLPQVRAWQDDIEIEYDHEQALQQHSYLHSGSPVHPFSIMVENETLLDDLETSHYLSSAISSSSSGQCSPVNKRHVLRRPVSYTSPSPLQKQNQKRTEAHDEKPIVGVPFKPTLSVDPILERMPARRRSLNDSPNHEASVKATTKRFGSLISRLKKPFFK